MGIYLEPLLSIMAFHADIAVRMACLTGCEVSPGLFRMRQGPLMLGERSVYVTILAVRRGKGRVVRTDGRERNVSELPPMRVRRKRPAGEFAVALGTELFCVVTAVACPFVLTRFYGVYFSEIAPVRLGHIIRTKVCRMKIGIYAAAIMAVETE